MSRSRKKHCGIACCGSTSYSADKPWKKQWHKAIRAKENDLLKLQQKNPEDDYSYPVPNEAGDPWLAPSDGGSHLAYICFEEYYHKQTRPRLNWIQKLLKKEPPAREAAWRDWITKWVGK
jgi:hypothetical protein